VAGRQSDDGTVWLPGTRIAVWPLDCSRSSPCVALGIIRFGSGCACLHESEPAADAARDVTCSNSGAGMTNDRLSVVLGFHHPMRSCATKEGKIDVVNRGCELFEKRLAITC